MNILCFRSVYIVYTMIGDVCVYVVGKDEYDELACENYTNCYFILFFKQLVQHPFANIAIFCLIVAEVIFVITTSVKDVCGKPPTERLFLDKYGRICLCLDEIVWKV